MALDRTPWRSIFRRGSSHTLRVFVRARTHLAASRHRRRPNAAGRTAGEMDGLDTHAEVSFRPRPDNLRVVLTLSSCVPIRSDGPPSLLVAICRGTGSVSQGVGGAGASRQRRQQNRADAVHRPPRECERPLDAGTGLRNPVPRPMEIHLRTVSVRTPDARQDPGSWSGGNFPEMRFGVRFQMRSTGDRGAHAAPAHHHRVLPLPTSPTTPAPGPWPRGVGRRPRDGPELRPCPGGRRAPRRRRRPPAGRPPRAPN